MRAPRLTEATSRRTAGFGLVEIIVAASLSAVLMAAVLSTFLMVARGGMNLANYSSMDGEARAGLDVFGRDIRQAETITWNSTTSFTVVVRGTPVTYALFYDTQNREWQFRRGARPIIKGLEPKSFKLTAYNVAFAPSTEDEDVVADTELRPVAVSLDDLARASQETKQLQLEFKTARQTPSLPATSNSVVSARFILRNKRVTS